jgi:hypothetical protein
LSADALAAIRPVRTSDTGGRSEMRLRKSQGLAQLLDRRPPAEVGTRLGDHRYPDLPGDVFELLTGALANLHGPEASSGIVPGWTHLLEGVLTTLVVGLLSP